MKTSEEYAELAVDFMSHNLPQSAIVFSNLAVAAAIKESQYVRP